MMLMARDHFEISANVNVDENPDAAKKLSEYFKNLLDMVEQKLSESETKLDVEIIDKKPRCRKFVTRLSGKDTRLAHFAWTGIDSSDDLKKWKDVWNEVEGMRGPCFFIHLNPNPLLRP